MRKKTVKKVCVAASLTAEQKKRLEAACPDYEFVYGKDEDAQIVIGYLPIAELKQFKRLEWLQTMSAGVERYIAKGALNEGVTLTNASGVHTREVAEHLLAVLLMMVKKLHTYRDDQKLHVWRDKGKVKEITKLKVTILGLGDIGSYLARQLKALGIHVIGVKRKAIEKPDFVDELYTGSELEKAISDVDAVISLLPGNRENVGLFTVDTFRKMRSDCIFINAGRGNLCDEETLETVLDEKIIAGIAADVYPKEPLPAGSPLWDHENLVVTPHAAGGYHLDSATEALIDLCIENLNRYREGKPLKNLISERE